MTISFFSIFTVFGILSSWATKALADGKVTLVEALELIQLLGTALNLPLEFDVSEILGMPKDETVAPVDEVLPNTLKESPILKQ